MSIELTRIDDKLIHAQIIWGWVPLIKPSQLIVVNDAASKDNLRKKILTTAAEPLLDHSAVKILSLAEALIDVDLRKNDEKKIILVMSEPVDVVYLIKNNINIRKVSLGYMSDRPGKKRIFETVFMNDDDIKAFRQLIDMGVDVEYQASPLDKPIKATKSILS
jgi:mannose/fructose/N-acetylgalactosamine-specific phosphotransferase system component IIB